MEHAIESAQAYNSLLESLTNQCIFVKSMKKFYASQWIFSIFIFTFAQPKHICQERGLTLMKTQQHYARQCFLLILPTLVESQEPFLIWWFERLLAGNHFSTKLDDGKLKQPSFEEDAKMLQRCEWKGCFNAVTVWLYIATGQVRTPSKKDYGT